MSNAFRYRAFGLSIASALPLPAPPEPDAEGAPIDLTIRLGPLLEPPVAGDGFERISPAVHIDQREPDHWRLFAFGANPAQRFTASIRHDEIEVGWNLGVEASDVAQHLLGIVLAAHTYVSGRICLHASAVMVGERTIVILGDSGRGKSTLAAAWVAMGARLVSEELVVLGEDPSLVSSGLPTVKVSETTAAALGLTGLSRKAFVHPDFANEGVRLDFDEARCVPSGYFPMAEIYRLGPRHAGTEASLSQPLTPAVAADALARAAYWMPHLPKATRLRVMRSALDIALRHAVRSLELPDDLSVLRRTIDRIDTHAV